MRLNLLIGSLQLHYEWFVNALSPMLQREGKSIRLIGFVSSGSGPTDLPPRLENVADWEFVCTNAGSKQSFGKSEASTNCDNLMLLHTGLLIKPLPCDMVIVGTGDGALGCVFAGVILDIDRSKRILSRSISGSSTSHFHSPRKSNIGATIFVGFDCLTPDPPNADAVPFTHFDNHPIGSIPRVI